MADWSDIEFTVGQTDYIAMLNEWVARTQAAATAGEGQAPLASPIFTGTPKAPTPGAGDNSQRLATTAFVQTLVGSVAGSVWTVGTGAPASGMGGAGWFYLDSATGDLYRKAGGAWGSPLMNILGPAGPGATAYPFAYGDATPALVAEVRPGQRVKEVALQILVPFDGGGAALSVGDATDAGRLLPGAQVDPASEAVYIANPGLLYPDGGELFLSIAPGAGASTGRGVLFITLA